MAASSTPVLASGVVPNPGIDDAQNFINHEEINDDQGPLAQDAALKLSARNAAIVQNEGLHGDEVQRALREQVPRACD